MSHILEIICIVPGIAIAFALFMRVHGEITGEW
jgi:hypothetical protein